MSSSSEGKHEPMTKFMHKTEREARLGAAPGTHECYLARWRDLRCAASEAAAQEGMVENLNLTGDCRERSVNPRETIADLWPFARFEGIAAGQAQGWL